MAVFLGPIQWADGNVCVSVCANMMRMVKLSPEELSGPRDFRAEFCYDEQEFHRGQKHRGTLGEGKRVSEIRGHACGLSPQELWKPSDPVSE